MQNRCHIRHKIGPKNPDLIWFQVGTSSSELKIGILTVNDRERCRNQQHQEYFYHDTTMTLNIQDDECDIENDDNYDDGAMMGVMMIFLQNLRLL